MAILSDEFYYQSIRIDTINTRVFADLVAKEGDANGRGLLVTLTENGLMKDTTGITLILKWEHTSVGNQGLDNFEAVDLSKGLYKITYPTEMLNRGKVRAFIQIIDGGKLAGTRNIEITVDRGVGDDTAIASSDSFTALAQALIDVNNLESTYAPRLLSAEQQLADIITLKGLKTVEQDPSFDNAVIINNAIQSLSRGVIKLPYGKFNYTSKILNNKSFVSVEGQGIGATILEYSGDPSVPSFELTGELSPAYRAYQNVKNLSIVSKTNKDGIGLSIRINANFSLENVKIERFNIGLNSFGALIGEFNNLVIESNNVGLLLEKDDARDLPPNLITFNQCKIIGNERQAIKALSPTQIILNGCEIEGNGFIGSNLNICEFLNAGSIGVIPSITVNNTWFEHNKGNTDIYIENSTEDTGAFINGSSFYSTDVVNNVLIDSGRNTLISCGLNASTSGDNLKINGTGNVIGSSMISFSITYPVLVFSNFKNMLSADLNLQNGKFINLYLDNTNKTSITANDGSGYTAINPYLGLKVNKNFSPPDVTQVDAGNSTLFIDSETGKLCYKNNAGVVTVLTP